MKKIYFLFATIALLAIMASCTPAGAELGLVGEWKRAGDSDYVMEIEDDDTITVSYKGITIGRATIVKADSARKSITLKDDGSGNEYTCAYSLSGNSLILGAAGYLRK